MRPDFMCGSCSHGKHDTYPCVACSCGHDVSDDARIDALKARIRELEAQLAAARDNALEEAARKAERDFPSGDMGAAMRASYTAESIRALKSQAAPRAFTLEDVERSLDAIGADPGGGLLEDLRSVLTGGGE